MAGMIVISNSSVLIALSSIGKLELLEQRFPEGVIVPDAVWREVVETGQGRRGARKVADAEWISRMQVKNQGLFPSLANELSLLRREGRFRLSENVYECALKQVGE
jgi:uncharacterized protein